MMTEIDFSIQVVKFHQAIPLRTLIMGDIAGSEPHAILC